MKKIRIAAGAVFVALITAQAIRISKTNPPVESDIKAPPQVAALLRRACYDCHSNETVWPWYSNVAPVSWLLANDVKEGRRELNFSVWDTYDAKKRAKKLKKTAEEVAGGEMPPWYYVLIHSRARLTDTERQTLRSWTSEEIGTLSR